nr:hypothetical protein [Bacillaceae bacterium]
MIPSFSAKCYMRNRQKAAGFRMDGSGKKFPRIQDGGRRLSVQNGRIREKGWGIPFPSPFWTAVSSVKN